MIETEIKSVPIPSDTLTSKVSKPEKFESGIYSKIDGDEPCPEMFTVPLDGTDLSDQFKNCPSESIALSKVLPLQV